MTYEGRILSTYRRAAERHAEAVEAMLTRRCPTCHAAPGQGCRTRRTGRPTRIHARRISGPPCRCTECRNTSPTDDTNHGPNVSPPSEEHVTPQ